MTIVVLTNSFARFVAHKMHTRGRNAGLTGFNRAPYLVSYGKSLFSLESDLAPNRTGDLLRDYP
jgi:hypothetical protein